MTPSSANRWIAIGALIGAAGVALGAYGAHGLAETLKSLGYVDADLAHRLGVYETAARYQMYHALALVLVGVLMGQRPTASWRIAGWCFLVGVLLFSGLLYVLAFAGEDWKWLGAVVPFGGLAFIVGWLALAYCALFGKQSDQPA